ncbi:Ig-like domain-containing protein [Actinomycetes bacterium KLBMP 9759]
MAAVLIGTGVALVIVSEMEAHNAPVAPAPVALRVAVSPADASTGVVPAEPIRVDVMGGTLADVTVTADDGKVLPGGLSTDGQTWLATQKPAFGTTYRLTATGLGETGPQPITSTFTTVAAKRLVKATSNIGDGDVVGVAAPVEIRFDRRIAESDRAAAEKVLSVRTSVPVEGSWGWLPDNDWESGSRVHWRPATYWPAGTTVTVTAGTRGVDLGAAGFGSNDLTATFGIGRSQIVKADVTSHRMVVVRDGQVVSDLPASYGLEADPRRVTRNGTHIVMSKSPSVLMTNPTFDYENVLMHWAVRISNNGEFIHANPASGWAQGRSNVTHGCVNLSTANARAYYDTAIYGDPVEVTGSTVPMTRADGDVYDWAIPWEQWKTMSALDDR